MATKGRQPSGDQYRLIVEHSPTMIWRAGLDARCDYFNDVWLAYTGRTLEQEVGDGWTEGVHEDDLERCVRCYLDHFERREPFEMEYRLRRHDGAHRWIIDRGVPYADDAGAFAGYIGSCVDIHERRLAEERARVASDQQLEAIRARDVFLSMASHELRTPLQPLKLHLQSIAALGRPGATELPAAPVLEKVDKAITQVHHLVELVERLLDVSRVTHDPLALSPAPLDLVALVREVVERHQPQARRVGPALTLRAPRSLAGVWDRMRLDQVLSNLLSNALKYGQGRPIEVEVEGDDASATLRVIDHGIGIAPEDQARIFGRFQRAVSPRHYGGFGLGLWICAKLVEAMRGRLEVRSALGQGSTFTLVLPRR